MLEAFHNGKFEYKRISQDEQKKRGILGRLTGIIADTTEPTRNGRLYSKKLWQNVFNDPIMKEKIANKCLFMELGHPTDRTEVDMEKICACLAEQPKIGDDGKIYGTVDILDTKNGRLLKTLCDYGTNVGISSRGEGDLITSYDGQEEVDPDTYTCETWDIVLIPAIRAARLQYVTEGLDTKRYNKTLRQSLQESLEKASDVDRKIMEESLETLGINLDNNNDTEVNETEDTSDVTDSVELDEMADRVNIVVNVQDSNGDVYGTWDVRDRAAGFNYVNDNPENKDLSVVYSRYKNGRPYGKQLLARRATLSDIERYADSDSRVHIYINGEWMPKGTDFNELKASLDNPDDVVLVGFGSKITEALEESELNQITECIEYNLFSSSAINESRNDLDPHINGLADTSKKYFTKDDADKCLEKGIDPYTGVPTYLPNDNKNDTNAVDKNINESISIDDSYQYVTTFDNWWGTEDIYISEQAHDAYGHYTNIHDDIWNDWLDKKDSKEINENLSNINSIAVENNEAMVEELQNSIKANAELEQQILDLKEQVSVCYTKETQFKEEAEKYKGTIQRLAENAKLANALQAKVSMLESKLNETNKQKDELWEQLSEATNKISKQLDNTKSLKESVSNKMDQVGKLNESVTTLTNKLKLIKESYNKAQKELNESKVLTDKLNADNKALSESYNLEKNKLNESIAQLEKDLKLQKTEYSQKLNKSNSLVEKYKSIASSAVDKYINLQAIKLGSSVNEIKNRLPESYTFKDIDRVCEDLQSYNLNMSKLPINTLARNTVNESIKIKGTSSKNESILPVNGFDDDIDEDLMYLAGRK